VKTCTKEVASHSGDLCL